MHEGIKVKFPNGFPSPEYEERMNREIEVITSMGYAGYHLIVQDYLAYGRLLGYLNPDEIANAPLSIEELDKQLTESGNLRIGHGIGPGRGSAAGSLCCYLLGITDVDPIKYDLLFERFLNKDRVSMPDIDSDFKTDIREKVIEYCANKYGKDNVCRIMTKTYGSSSQSASKDEESEEDNRMSQGNIREAARYLLSEENFYKMQEAGQNEEKQREELANSTERKKTYLNSSDRLAKRFGELRKLKDKQGNELDANKIFSIMEKEISETSKTPELDLKILRLAVNINGLFTGYGQHAAGVIISKDPIRDIVPLFYNKSKQNFQTQCLMSQAEAKGLLKMDFLGLTNLDIITNICRYPSDESQIEGRLQNYEEREKIFNDANIYNDIFANGYTQGIFQFEAPAMKRYLKNLRPENFEDIVLLNAANRPGPQDYIPEITAWKWYNKFNGDYEQYSAKIKEIYPFNAERMQEAKNAGLEYEYSKFYDERGNVLKKPGKTITIDCPALNKILEPTYGCPIYQEQIMRIFQDMAGYSLGGADIVRRYMSKKKMDKLAHEEQAFIYGDPERGIDGCMKKQNITEQQAKELFDQMMPFAKYGFNKSHAVAYSQVAVYTAFLKRYHTLDFFRYSLKATKAIEEIDDFVSEMRKFGIRLLPPDIMKSKNDFTVEIKEENGKTRKDIRFGLTNIKNVTKGAWTIEHPTTCVQEFIRLNPDVPTADIEIFAQLGLFKTRWETASPEAQAKEEKIVNGSRKAILMWIAKYCDSYKKLLRHHDNAVALRAQLKQMEAEGKKETPEYAEISKEFEKTKVAYKNLGDKMQTEATNDPEGILNPNYNSVTPHVISASEVRENRNVEMDLLRNCYDIKESYYKLQKSGKRTTFADVERAGKALDVPCIILKTTDVPYYTGKHNPYYLATIMDMKGHVITRRFDTPLANMTEGILQINPDCKRYFISKESHQSLGVSFGENSRKETPIPPLPEYHKAAQKTLQEGKEFFQKITKNESEEKEEEQPDDGSDDYGDDI